MIDPLILIVEDNPDDKELIIRAFKKNNIDARLLLLSDGVEALHFLNRTGNFTDRDEADIPGLILLDLKLPKVDGKEVLKAYREDPYFRHIPVIILSSSGEKKDIHDAYTLGANSYIKKPIDFSHFLDIVGMLNKYWLSINLIPAP